MAGIYAIKGFKLGEVQFGSDKGDLGTPGTSPRRPGGLMLLFRSTLLLNSNSFCQVEKEEGTSDWF